jgi:hypothetical protein
MSQDVQKNTVDRLPIKIRTICRSKGNRWFRRWTLKRRRKIKEGTSLALSRRGTYAAAHREGLDIFPAVLLVLEESGSLNDEDVDALVRFFHLG